MCKKKNVMPLMQTFFQRIPPAEFLFSSLYLCWSCCPAQCLPYMCTRPRAPLMCFEQLQGKTSYIKECTLKKDSLFLELSEIINNKIFKYRKGRHSDVRKVLPSTIRTINYDIFYKAR